MVDNTISRQIPASNANESFSFIIGKDEAGYYAHVPALPDCYAQGNILRECQVHLT